MIEQVARMAGSVANFTPLDSMAKVFADRAEKFPEGSNERQTLEAFVQAQKSGNKAQINQMVTSGQLANIVGRIESQMIQKAINGTLSPTEYVYGAVMASAEREATAKGDISTAEVFVANAFNTDKISTMLKTHIPTWGHILPLTIKITFRVCA